MISTFTNAGIITVGDNVTFVVNDTMKNGEVFNIKEAPDGIFINIGNDTEDFNVDPHDVIAVN